MQLLIYKIFDYNINFKYFIKYKYHLKYNLLEAVLAFLIKT